MFYKLIIELKYYLLFLLVSDVKFIKLFLL